MAETAYVHSGNSAGSVANRTDTWNGIAQSLQGVLQPNQTYDISAWLLLAGGSSQTMQLTVAESRRHRNIVCAGRFRFRLHERLDAAFRTIYVQSFRHSFGAEFVCRNAFQLECRLLHR